MSAVPGQLAVRAIDLFAGSGGWDTGARCIGIDPVGIEIDDAACATRRAAGLRTVQGDVAAQNPRRFYDLWVHRQPGPSLDGLIGSPPCPPWSAGGHHAGDRDLEHVVACALELVAGKDTRAEHRAKCEDERSILTVEPLRWALALQPTWIALEQVPGVIDLWTMYAQIFDQLGYSTWTGVLCAADYGVPQTRRRAVLIASRDRVAHPPEPTHSQTGGVTLFGELEPWVTMAQALGWGMTERPSVTVTAGSGRQGGPSPLDGGSDARRTLRVAKERGAWAWDRPATTVCGDPRIPEPGWRGNPEDYADGNPTRSGDKAIRVSVSDAAVLQSFPADYPFQGTQGQQFMQVGNAVPPRMAAAVLRQLVPAFERAEIAA